MICGGLPVVVGRRVHYGRVDPAAAHAIFLREGLLEGGLRQGGRFAANLTEVRQTLEGIEQKLRRPGGLWSDEAVLRFLSERVPAAIHTAAAFHQWLASDEDALLLDITDVLDEDQAELGVEHFPDVISHAGDEYQVYYHAQQGERDDGVTLGVHVDQLTQLPVWLPGWGVDGNLRERAEVLLRSLPKDYRRGCHPIGAVAAGFAELWCGAPKDGPVVVALSDYVRQSTGASVPVEAYDSNKLAAHLVTKIWVCDDAGEELAMGEDVAGLQLQLAAHLRTRCEAAANAGLERSGIIKWEGAALPAQVSTPGGSAYPALVDEGSSVGVRAFSSSAAATHSHRGGGARLLWLAHPQQVAQLRRKFPLGLATRVELPRLGVGGTTVDELILLAAEGAAGGEFPTDPAAFRELEGAARGRWFEAAAALGASLDETLTILPEIRAWTAAQRNDRNLGAVAADIDEQLAWLLRPEFAWRAGFGGLLDYPRRLRALRSRLGRLAALPLIKDLEKMARLRRWWQPWFLRWSAQPEDPALWPYGWALEELRVALFAPDVPAAGRVSEKVLEKLWEDSR